MLLLLIACANDDDLKDARIAALEELVAQRDYQITALDNERRVYEELPMFLMYESMDHVLSHDVIYGCVGQYRVRLSFDTFTCDDADDPYVDVHIVRSASDQSVLGFNVRNHGPDNTEVTGM